MKLTDRQKDVMQELRYHNEMTGLANRKTIDSLVKKRLVLITEIGGGYLSWKSTELGKEWIQNNLVRAGG